jgi:hypothetical protein
MLLHQYSSWLASWLGWSVGWLGWVSGWLNYIVDSDDGGIRRDGRETARDVYQETEMGAEII